MYLVQNTVFNMKVYVLILGVSFYSYADGAVAPFIAACRAADTACLKSSAQAAVPVLAAGVPSLGINVLDPMHVPRVATNEAGLDLEFRDTVVKGLRNCVVESLRREGNKTFFDLRCSIIMTGNYTLGGQLLIFPIEGNGQYKIKIRDILVKIVFEATDRIENGQLFWHVYSWKHTSEVLTNANFHFQNLFNGNKQLSDTIHEFANSNWRAIFHEVAPPIVKAIVSKIVLETTKVFDKVPKNELELP